MEWLKVIIAFASIVAAILLRRSKLTRWVAIPVMTALLVVGGFSFLSTFIADRGALAATEDVRPNATAAEAGGTCTTSTAHTNMDDDVEGGGDSNVCTADSATANHDIRLNLATPSDDPVTTANAQTFKALAINSQTSGSGVATLALDLYCNGSLVEAGADQNLSDSYATISETFTFNSGSCAADGSDVEVLVDCTAANNGGTNNDTSCTYEAVEWVAEVPDNQPPTVALNTADATDFGSDTTPTLEFTGTDADSDDVRYNVQVANSTPISGGGLADEYDSSNFSSSYSMQSGGITATSQSFTGVGGVLDKAYMRFAANAFSASGPVTLAIYAHSGTFGASSVPTGSALATSEAIDASTFPSGGNNIEFTFSGANRITLSAGTEYALVANYSGANILINQIDATSPTHSGNAASFNGSWTANSGDDSIFGIYIENNVSIDAVSGTDAGFANTVTGGDTDPFNSGEKASYTVQAGDELSTGTWYWRVRGIDPTGSNTYGAWATARSFTVTADDGTNGPAQIHMVDTTAVLEDGYLIIEN